MTSCLLCAGLAAPLSGAQEPDRVYGSKIVGEAKSAAVEDCEYEELVEKQSCNTRLNKTSCIDEVIEACARRFAPPDSETPAEPQPQPQPQPQP